MGTILRFEDLFAWQKARELARVVFGYTTHGSFARDARLVGQIRASSESGMSNITEGFERGGTAEFRHFLSIAKSSVGEVSSQLYTALDRGYITQAEFQVSQDLATDALNLIGGLDRYLLSCEFRGVKFRPPKPPRPPKPTRRPKPPKPPPPRPHPPPDP